MYGYLEKRFPASFTMKALPEIVSKATWFHIGLCFLPIWLVVFRPSWKEILIAFVVDSVSLAICSPFESRIFTRLNPGFSRFFPTLPSDAELAALSADQRASLLTAMMKFPLARAKYVAVFTLIKIIPAFLVIVLVWQYEGSSMARTAQAFFLSAVAIAYFLGATFFESHQFCSNLVDKWHRDGDWTAAFALIRFDHRPKELDRVELFALVSIVTLTVAAAISLLQQTAAGKGLTAVSVQVGVVGAAGLLLLVHSRYLNRRLFMGAIEKLFARLGDFDPTREEKAIALHSLPVLARFEGVYNFLGQKVREYDRELTHWTSIQLEENRYRSLGEISALILHDLSGPLHVMSFCSEQLAVQPELAAQPRYQEYLARSVARCLELVSSLREYLKGQRTGELESDFSEAWMHATRILQPQFFDRGFTGVTFKVPDELSGQRIKLSRTDLIHVLINLLSNSLENMLAHKVDAPSVTVELDPAAHNDSGVLDLLISDSGTGLTRSHFESMTSLSGAEAKEQGTSRSLGLKLVRRLIERKGGAIEIVEPPRFTRGTTFRLRLPRGGVPA